MIMCFAGMQQAIMRIQQRIQEEQRIAAMGRADSDTDMAEDDDDNEDDDNENENENENDEDGDGGDGDGEDDGKGDDGEEGKAEVAVDEDGDDEGGVKRTIRSAYNVMDDWIDDSEVWSKDLKLLHCRVFLQRIPPKC
jgi:hypothetical protein